MLSDCNFGVCKNAYKKERNEVRQNTLHEYYTPKSTKIQVLLYIFTIFVDYADFYVNIVM